MDRDETSASSTTRAPRLPAAETQGRQSLTRRDLASLPANDRAAVEHLLAMPALDED
jgi:hypothetical protein